MNDKIILNIDIKNDPVCTALKQVAEQVGIGLDPSGISITADILKEKRQKISAVIHDIYMSASVTDACFDFGGLSVDSRHKVLNDKDGIAFNLTDLEVSILTYLYNAKGVAVSKDRFLKDVWKYQKGVTTHTVETHIYRLRQKIPALSEHLVTTDDGYVLK